MNFSSDLDGTLTNENIGTIIDEQGLVWNDYESQGNAVAKFTPKKGVEVLNRFGLRPIIITGRQESLRNETEQWLKKNNIPFKKLIMIPDNGYNGDFDWNVYIKFKIDEHLKYDLRFALEDHQSMVTLLNKYGVPTFQVTDDYEKTFFKAVNATQWSHEK